MQVADVRERLLRESGVVTVLAKIRRELGAYGFDFSTLPIHRRRFYRRLSVGRSARSEAPPVSGSYKHGITLAPTAPKCQLLEFSYATGTPLGVTVVTGSPSCRVTSPRARSARCTRIHLGRTLRRRALRGTVRWTTPGLASEIP